MYATSNKRLTAAILLLGRSRSYGPPDGRAAQDFIYRSRRLSLKRNGLLLDVRFRMLDNVVFFERASGNAMHERAGDVVYDGSKAILVQAQKAADVICLTVASSYWSHSPRTSSSFFHFETVDKFTAISRKFSNTKTRPHQVDLPVELSRNECALRSGNCELHYISSKPLDASSGPGPGCAVAAHQQSVPADRAGDCARAI